MAEVLHGTTRVPGKHPLSTTEPVLWSVYSSLFLTICLGIVWAGRDVLLKTHIQQQTGSTPLRHIGGHITGLQGLNDSY